MGLQRHDFGSLFSEQQVLKSALGVPVFDRSVEAQLFWICLWVVLSSLD